RVDVAKATGEAGGVLADGAFRHRHEPAVEDAAADPGVRIGSVAGDDAHADRCSAQIADASAVCRGRVVDHRDAHDGATPKEYPAAVRLRNVVAHDAVRDRKQASDRDPSAVQGGGVPADRAAIDGECRTGDGRHGDAAALAARVVTTDEAVDHDARTGAREAAAFHLRRVAAEHRANDRHGTKVAQTTAVA